MKATDKQIIEAFENNEEGLNKTQLATKLGISLTALNKRLAKLSVKARDIAKEYAQKRILLTMQELAKQSAAGKTQATESLLKLAEVNPTISIGDGNWNINISKVLSAPPADSEAKAE